MNEAQTADAQAAPQHPSGTPDGYRVERDSMGEVRVPADALWRAQTQRGVEKFTIRGSRAEHQMIESVGLGKWAAGTAN